MTNGTTRLELVIVNQEGKESRYRLVNLDPHRGIASEAWRLMKCGSDGKPMGEKETYDLAMRDFGIDCTCPDGNYRKHACKHARAMQANGLMRGRKPVEPDAENGDAWEGD